MNTESFLPVRDWRVGLHPEPDALNIEPDDRDTSPSFWDRLLVKCSPPRDGLMAWTTERPTAGNLAFKYCGAGNISQRRTERLFAGNCAANSFVVRVIVRAQLPDENDSTSINDSIKQLLERQLLELFPAQKSRDTDSQYKSSLVPEEPDEYGWKSYTAKVRQAVRDFSEP